MWIKINGCYFNTNHISFIETQCERNRGEGYEPCVVIGLSNGGELPFFGEDRQKLLQWLEFNPLDVREGDYISL